MDFEFIDRESKFLEAVMDLGKRNSGTLGFMPVGGFLEHAKKRWILIAHENNSLLGYILFRTGLKNTKISIAHLCVDQSSRGKQVSIKLLDQLRLKYDKTLSGISLSCRSDYKYPNKLWENYGFIAKNKVRSRSQEENYLIKWWYDFNNIDLFSFPENSKHKVLLDMNVLIRLRDANKNNSQNQLLPDWLTEEVEYFYAQEFYNEINRDSDKDRSKKTKAFVETNFSEIKFDKEEAKIINSNLESLLKNNKKNDNSDIKQISECIASNINYFITLDDYLLSKSSIISEEYDLEIISPEELILKIDKLIDNNNYHPIRLSGATHTTNKIQPENLNIYVTNFLRNDKSENRAQFHSKVTKIITNIKNGTIKTVDCTVKGSIAFWGYEIIEDRVSIKFIRTFNNNLEITLFTQLVFEIIAIAIEQNKLLVEVYDDYFCEQKQGVLKDFGFVLSQNVWKKVAIKDLINSSELTIKYPIVYKVIEANQLENIFSEVNEEQRKNSLYKLERMFFPIKFRDLNIPCYIIPIKRYWAGQLFDRYNSSQDFFGADPTRIWNRENVYYRSLKPVTEKFPARILWYVSTHRNQNRQKSIVAVSYLDKMEIDLVKQQYKKYERYGIYEWEHVYELANNNVENYIKSIKFSDTEVFKNEIPFNEISNILIKNNHKKNTFASPVNVSPNVFNDIYQTSIK